MANKQPDTSGLKPFKPGQSGNPGGKTSEQRRLEIENAERATRLHNRMLAGLEKQLDQAEEDGDAVAVQMINMQILKLIKDAQDRGLGQPEQAIDLTTKGDKLHRSVEEMTLAEIEAELAEITDGGE